MSQSIQRIAESTTTLNFISLILGLSPIVIYVTGLMV